MLARRKNPELADLSASEAQRLLSNANRALHQARKAADLAAVGRKDALRAGGEVDSPEQTTT
ncbi:MAG: hypothetical protein IPJ61_04855 [Tessaracoccus sp.]|nr:hypothetical protein [Tessaracoccus sp.]